jgi:hypothetical protein
MLSPIYKLVWTSTRSGIVDFDGKPTKALSLELRFFQVCLKEITAIGGPCMIFNDIISWGRDKKNVPHASDVDCCVDTLLSFAECTALRS